MTAARDQIKADLEAALDTAKKALNELPLEDRAVACGDVLAALADGTVDVGHIRRDALGDMLAQGTELKDMPHLLGIGRTRVEQLLFTERAFFGTAAVTIAIGAKRETRSEGSGGPNVPSSAVMSEQAVAAFSVLSRVIQGYGLQVNDLEPVPPPGDVDLNRPNLIVVTSPRLLRNVMASLAADAHLKFASDDHSWFLVDKTTGTTYRSPMDDGEPADYGYVGRLPRPDNNGTFLYIAGIHAMGTLGIARFLADNVSALFKEVRNRRWSGIVKTTFDPDTFEIVSTELVTPVYPAK